METIASVDIHSLEARVKKMYTRVANDPGGDFHFELGRELAERLGYSKSDLDNIPAESIESFAGVGCFFDMVTIPESGVVVDLGSGSGMDAFIAAMKVSSSGKVIGIDMTYEQLKKSRHLSSHGGFGHIDFYQSYIEKTPVEDGTADVVISNGVINLSPHKNAVFTEAARILKPGGQLALADIVSSQTLPESISCNSALWASCIGGAIPMDQYISTIEQCGLRIETIRENCGYSFISKSAVSATEKYGIKSISLVAKKE